LVPIARRYFGWKVRPRRSLLFEASFPQDKRVGLFVLFSGLEEAAPANGKAAGSSKAKIINQPNLRLLMGVPFADRTRQIHGRGRNLMRASAAFFAVTAYPL
jgi:hypothetical protein